ncbi:uridylate-specific endoribonuclease-like isoform X2 [Amphiura filiformis]|uniref:uridylate-specific endoribonuclease-like isoform X2 n=1 Tax=Amphiura filiformis TaxID=82378 RepID=UPI003B21E33D
MNKIFCAGIVAVLLIMVIIGIGIGARAYFGSTGKGADDSCVGRCDSPLDVTKPCQCNTACERYEDCCADYQYTCLGAAFSCYSQCGRAYDPADNCHCNSLCKQYDNCCGDYDAYCIIPDGTCYGRCDDPIDSNLPCQCNSACLTNGDCCPDYSDECGGSGGGITPGALSALADDLWASDTSRADPSEYTINKQAQVADGNTVDQSSEPLFSFVDEAAVFSRPTFAAFINLLDNYNPNYGVDEVRTPGKEAEHVAFMDAIMATKVMTKTVNFLAGYGYVTDAADFRAKIEHAWFTLYDRSSPKDSSGFEHVFLGEYKSGSKVNGFHNWVQFYLKEKAGEINYLGYVRDDEAVNNIGANFVWNGYNKALGGFLYGSSVEFDLAMMGTCFITMPGKVCRFNLNGNPTSIQTYTIFTTMVGSAYFVV